jgi:c-di-GMP-binding flagellar brake protein YcgR
MMERRQFLRLKEVLIIRYYVIGGGRGDPYQLKEAEVVDSSQGGLRLKTDDVLENNSLVEIEIMLPLRPGAETYKRAVVLGKVVYSGAAAEGGGNKYGVQFVHVDEDMEKEIDNYIVSRLAGGAEVATET